MKKANDVLKRPSLLENFLRAALLVAVIISLAVLQSAWPDELTLFGARPNLTLVFLVCFSLRQSGLFSCVLGVGIGFVLDLACGKPWLSSALFYLYISFGCVWISKRMFFRSFKTTAAGVFMFSLFYSLTEAGLSFFLQHFFALDASFLLLKVLMNVLCMLFVYPLARLCTKESRCGFEESL